MKDRTDEASETHPYQFHPQTTITTITAPMLRPEMPVPAKARSKRSRAAPGNWTSRLLVLSPTPLSSAPAMPASSESDIVSKSKSGEKTVMAAVKKEEGFDTATTENGGEGRKCLHCAIDKTPQWRTGPMGPKTLCNACGVRYKSGRLVPEYRPAASPTFVLTKHSNSHRKVLVLRRQKELMRAHQHQQFLHQNIMFDVTEGDGHLIHQHIQHDYEQLI
ncbi:GATA transcription factor 12 [Abeliophyllum distichum]|uniref:GATA transcription factor 12 n=1 Tax=Abeliophyllum distichum TaxID=126358 RepID=A0ABD1TVW4_9LAMI